MMKAVLVITQVYDVPPKPVGMKIEACGRDGTEVSIPPDLSGCKYLSTLYHEFLTFNYHQPVMAQFRAKKLDLSCFVNVRVIRDHTKRKVFEQYETQRYIYNALLHAARQLISVPDRLRQALRYIIRNTTLPPRARAQAQLQLSQMHAYTRSTQINNRCIEGGKSRGVLRHFRMARID
ncbi:MAG: hypothetical protein Q9205_001335 [Flavoplaca limonia]